MDTGEGLSVTVMLTGGGGGGEGCMSGDVLVQVSGVGDVRDGITVPT